MLLIAKLMVSIAVVGAAVVPAVADLNYTHATNPRWSGHARFHVVWQCTSYLALGAVALMILWAPALTEGRGLIYVAGAIAVSIYGGFFLAVATMRRYDGQLADDNGHGPLRVRTRLVDKNLLVFCGLVAVLLVGGALAAASGGGPR